MVRNTPQTLWPPGPVKTMPMDKYRAHINTKFHQRLTDTKELQRWSVDFQQDFYLDLYSYIGLVPALPPSVKRAYDESLPMSSIPPFFEGLCLNYSENALFANPDDSAIAVVGVRESDDLDKYDGEQVTWKELRERVRTVASALRRRGIKQGDRVAALVSNSVWAVVLFHATAAIGAIFTSINPDLGIEGCLSRLNQVHPSIVFADSDACYKGKRASIIQKIQQLHAGLSHKAPMYVIQVSAPVTEFPSIEDFLSAASSSDHLEFLRVPFNYPLVIVYSSGTTGAPKCIVHQHGIIIQLKKISILHQGFGPWSTIVQYTRAKCVCYDGSPMYPDVRQMVKLVAKFRGTYLGSSPRYLLELEIARVVPKDEFDLSCLRSVSVTGASLAPEQYHWFYRGFGSSVHLINSAGGTDVATTIIGGDPLGPNYAGELEIMALGMAGDIADPVSGRSIAHTGEPGELVIRKAFPSMPPFFWGDKDGSVYKSAYFERFNDVDVWAQHDWVAMNPVTKGFTMSGRSDGVLNPSGIRFGSGEIYAIVEGKAFNGEILETLCVGRRRPQDTDETVFLFVKMKPGHHFSPELKQRLRRAIMEGLSARHVPKLIIHVDDIPGTINGKKVEIAVKQIISGKDIEISSTVSNPETLLSYKRFRDLESEGRVEKL